MRRLLLRIALVLLAWPSAAVACSCLKQPLTRDLTPDESASPFPTDGIVRVFFDGPWPEALRLAVATEYRLRGPDGALVPLRPKLDGTMLSLRPERPLQPDSTYVIERTFAYSGGRLLTDDERWTFAEKGDAAAIVRAWFPERAFRTASAADRTPPTPKVATARYSTVGGGGSCGPGESLVAELDTSALVAGEALGLEVRGQGVLWRDAHHPDWVGLRRAAVSDLLCSEPKIHIDVRRPPQVRAFAWSASGRRSAPSPWVTATATKDDDEDSPAIKRHKDRFAGREAASAPTSAAFLAPAVVEATPIPSGTVCPHGLRATTHHELPGTWIQHSQQVLRGGDRLWLRSQAGDHNFSPAYATEIGAAGSIGEPVPVGQVRDMVVATEVPGPAALVVGRQERDVGFRVWRPGADGAPIWERTFTDLWPRWHLVGGGSRVLVVWERPRETEIRSELWPAWAVLDAATGAELGHGDLGPLGPATQIKGFGWHGGHFVVGWEWVAASAAARTRGAPVPTGVEGAWVARIAPDGRVTSSFPVPGAEVPDALTPAGSGWIVSQRNVVTWLDAEGRVVAAPVTVPSSVVPFVSQLAAFGDAALVAGDGMFADAALAVVAQNGAVSAPLTPGNGPPALDPAWAVVGESIVAAFGVGHGREGWGIAVESYTCRTEARVGPPAVVEP